MTTIWKDQKPALLAMIFLAISLMLYPTVVLGGLDSILDWTGTGGNLTTVFPQLSSIVTIFAMLFLVTIVFAALALIVMGGVKAYKGEQAGQMLIMGMIMIMIFLMMFTIVLDAVDEALASANLASYTGLESILQIVPLLVFVVIGFEAVGLIGGGAYQSVKGKKK